MKYTDNRFTRYARFLFSLIPPAVLMFGTLLIIIFIANKLEGGIGVAIGIIAGGVLALSILLAYWNAVDWLNLRVIRSQSGSGNPELRDGEVVAFNGVVRIDAEPMVSPITHTSCAAYTYTIAVSRTGDGYGTATHRRGSRRVLAEGFHMVKTRIEGPTRVLKLCTLPSFEDDLRENDYSEKWSHEVTEQISKLSGTAESAGDGKRQSLLLEARHSIAEELHEDFCQVTKVGTATKFVVDEGVLPVDQTVCVIGTYDESLGGLTASSSRLGPNLMIYRGNTEEVLSRVGGEVSGYAKVAAVLIGIGVVTLGFSLLPTTWTSTFPVVGNLVTQ